MRFFTQIPHMHALLLCMKHCISLPFFRKNENEKSQKCNFLFSSSKKHDLYKIPSCQINAFGV